MFASARGAKGEGGLKHSVVVCGFLRDRLNDVPVLDYFAILQPVDIDDRRSARAGLAHGMIVDDHGISVSKDVFGLAVIVRELVLQEGYEAL